MGFLCLIDDEKIHSFKLSPNEWNTLKENYKLMQLTMPCCQTSAIPKSNKYGTQYFAHHAVGTCTSSSESLEHQFTKYLIAKTLHELGWTVIPEYRGSTPNKELWIADIYAEKGRQKIAFEVQWSPQSVEETERRQQKYIESSVRTLWLMRTTTTNTYSILDYQSYLLPAFCIFLDKTSKQMTISGFFDLKKGSFSLGELELTDFIHQLMQKRIRWTFKENDTAYLSLGLNETQCWRCHQKTMLVMTMDYYIEHEDQFYLITQESIYSENIPLEHFKTINHSYSSRYKIGEIKKRYSKTRGNSYISNGCYHCDALQGSFFHYSDFNAENLIHTEYLKVRASEELTIDSHWVWLKNLY